MVPTRVILYERYWQAERFRVQVVTTESSTSIKHQVELNVVYFLFEILVAQPFAKHIAIAVPWHPGCNVKPRWFIHQVVLWLAHAAPFLRMSAGSCAWIKVCLCACRHFRSAPSASDKEIREKCILSETGPGGYKCDRGLTSFFLDSANWSNWPLW